MALGFLSLPPEIRFIIYEYVAESSVSTERLLIQEEKLYPRPTRLVRGSIAPLYLTCRTIYRDFPSLQDRSATYHLFSGRHWDDSFQRPDGSFTWESPCDTEAKETLFHFLNRVDKEILTNVQSLNANECAGRMLLYKVDDINLIWQRIQSLAGFFPNLTHVTMHESDTSARATPGMFRANINLWPVGYFPVARQHITLASAFLEFALVFTSLKRIILLQSSEIDEVESSRDERIYSYQSPRQFGPRNTKVNVEKDMLYAAHSMMGADNRYTSRSVDGKELTHFRESAVFNTFRIRAGCIGIAENVDRHWSSASIGIRERHVHFLMGMENQVRSMLSVPWRNDCPDPVKVDSSPVLPRQHIAIRPTDEGNEDSSVLSGA